MNNDLASYKQDLLNKLYAPYQLCTLCPLGSQGRKNVVFGAGNSNASLMIIGEAPGQEEDRQGKPFVGRSGQLLNKIFDIYNVSREEIFITNIVKCRPPNNRKPLPFEMNSCKKILLLGQINIIKPKVICTLGATAIEGLLNESLDKPMKHIRGNELLFETIQVIPTYHPAFILRNPKALPNLVEDLEKAFMKANLLATGG